MTMKSPKVGEIVGNIPLNVKVGGVEGEDQDHLCFVLEDRVVRTETQEMDVFKGFINNRRGDVTVQEDGKHLRGNCTECLVIGV